MMLGGGLSENVGCRLSTSNVDYDKLTSSSHPGSVCDLCELTPSPLTLFALSELA